MKYDFIYVTSGKGKTICTVKNEQKVVLGVVREGGINRAQMVSKAVRVLFPR